MSNKKLSLKKNSFTLTTNSSLFSKIFLPDQVQLPLMKGTIFYYFLSYSYRRLRIQAINAVGTGLFSHPIHFYTKELPPSPPQLNASSLSYNSIKLKWGDSSSKKSLSVLTHCLQVQNKSGRSVFEIFLQ